MILLSNTELFTYNTQSDGANRLTQDDSFTYTYGSLRRRVNKVMAKTTDDK